MSSPYAIRSRIEMPTSIPNGKLFKSFQITPRAPSRRLTSQQVNKQQKMTAGRSSDELTPPVYKSKLQSVRRVFSHQQQVSVDLHSNSLNESSLLQEKCKKDDLDFQRVDQNIHSGELDHNLQQCNNEAEKDIDSNIDKDSAEEIVAKDKKRNRQSKNWSCSGVPYRKCHSSMEQKVVSVINKIKSGKDCHKQIETLIQKSRKVSIKELNNKYFVSGIQLICNLALNKEYKHIFSPQLISKLGSGIEDLKNRILAELDNIKGFQLKPSNEEEIIFEKLDLVRRAFKVLRKKLRSEKREEIQVRAVKAADWFLQNKVNNLCLFYQELSQC